MALILETRGHSKKLYKKRFKQKACLLNIRTIPTARAPMSAPAHGYCMVLILIQYNTIRLTSGLAGKFQCHRRQQTLSRIQKDKTRDHRNNGIRRDSSIK